MKGLKSLNEDFVFILEKQSSILEAKKGSSDDYMLEGIAAVFGKENNNHRIYEENEYLPHLDYLQDKIKQQRLLGELDHPEKFDISLKNISHLVTDLNYNKGDRTLKIKVKLLDTPAGRIAKSLVDAGIPLSISSRAAGSVGSDKKVQIKKIFTYDLVADPGFKNAQLERVYESCGYSPFEYAKIKSNSIINHLECLNESLGLKNQDSMMIYRVDNDEEFEKLLNKKEKTTNLMERNNEFVTSEELDQYSIFLKKEMDSMKSEMSRLRNTPVSESNTSDTDLRVSKLEKYAEYLAESLENTIKYNEYLAENLDKSISYSKYLAENVDKNISYSKYLAENMDQNISYTEYLAENLDKSISYSNYLAENVDKNISYTEYVAESVDKNGSVSYFDRFQKDWRQTKQVINNLPKIPMLIDSTGAGDPIFEDLQRDGLPVSGFRFTSTSKQQLMEGLASAIQQRKITFPQGHITEELEIFEYQYTATGVRYSAPQGFHDDCVMSLALAWQHYTRNTGQGKYSFA